MQQCAKICVKKCKRARTGKSILQMFAYSFLMVAIFNFVFFRHDSTKLK